jgi:DNA-directed RNA polymerase subunit RPC12/RpoP
VSASFLATVCPKAPALYRPRRPERTLLYRLVREHLETYLSLARREHEEIDPVPGYVEGAFRKYLECGIPSYGVARARCASCGYDFFVAFSCKTRGICPSCNTRRMVEAAAHLVDHVLPSVPHRQWVLSVPKRVRYLFRAHRETVGAVLGIFMRALETTLRRKSPGAPAASRFGAVAFVHHFGSSLNQHIHFHCIVTDGVFSEGLDGEALFHEATRLTEADIETVGRKTRRRVLRWLVQRGYLGPEAGELMGGWPHSGGFSVDGSVRLAAWERGALERLARYCSRPAFSAERLDRWDGETWVYRLRRPLASGETSLVLSPLELLSRLAALVPPPRRHGIHYYGVLSAHAKLRGRVVESAGPSGALALRLREAARRMGITPISPTAIGEGGDDGEWVEPEEFPSSFPYTWAMLLARIYESLPLVCPRCGSSMRIIAFITRASDVKRILDSIGEASEPPPISPSRAPPEEAFEFHQETSREEEFDFDQRTEWDDESEV